MVKVTLNPGYGMNYPAMRKLMRCGWVNQVQVELSVTWYLGKLMNGI